MQNWFSGLVTSTAFKYLITAAATWLAVKLGVDKGSLEGILTQLVALAAAAWGMWEASRNKVVIDGKKAVIPTDAAPVLKERAKTLVDLIKQQSR